MSSATIPYKAWPGVPLKRGGKGVCYKTQSATCELDIVGAVLGRLGRLAIAVVRSPAFDIGELDPDPKF